MINHSITQRFNFYYWREGNDEIDFVIERKGKAIGLEVKSGVAGSYSGMASFKKRFTPHKVLLIGNEGLPWPDFLSMNPLDLF